MYDRLPSEGADYNTNAWQERQGVKDHDPMGKEYPESRMKVVKVNAYLRIEKKLSIELGNRWFPKYSIIVIIE